MCLCVNFGACLIYLFGHAAARLGSDRSIYTYFTIYKIPVVRTVPVQVQPVKKKRKKKSCTGSLCAHMHGSVLPVPVLCQRILPMVRDKSISFGRLWVAINISKGFGRIWVVIDLSIHHV